METQRAESRTKLAVQWLAGSSWPQKTFDPDARELSNRLQVNEIGPDEATSNKSFVSSKPFQLQGKSKLKDAVFQVEDESVFS